MSDQTRRVVRFGVFEADLAAGQLRKDGLKVKLQELPFRILALLLEHPGQVISREALREKLWTADTFVEFENSLNTAVNRLRAALGDSADHPRYIETLPRRGYRFIGAVNGVQAVVMATSTPEERPARARLHILAPLAVILSVSLALNAALWLRTPENAAPPVRRYTITPPEDPLHPVISPNGRYVAYLTSPNSRGGSFGRTLWIHDLGKDASRAILGPANIRYPFWSPDSEFVGFQSSGEVKKISVRGGTPTSICKTPGPLRNRGDWSPDGRTVIFAPSKLLFAVSSSGGTPALLLGKEESQKSVQIRDPRFLPARAGSRAVLFAEGAPGDREIIALDLDRGRRKVLGRGNSPVWSPSGHVLYESSGVLWALPFSPATFEQTGEAFPIAEDAAFSRASVADDGTLVYRGPPGGRMQLVWLGRTGKELGAIGQPQRTMALPVLSPDEDRVVVVGREDEDHENSDVWIHDVARGLKTRLTRSAAMEDRPTWSPAGDKISFSSERNGVLDLYIRAADGTGEAELIFSTPFHKFVTDWSPDGDLISDHDCDTLFDILHLRRDEDGGEYKAVPFLTTPYRTFGADVSPDGQFIAYESDESGRLEVYVQPFPEGGPPVQVSTHGGRQPRWRDDGREMFYVEDDVNLMAVAVNTGPAFAVVGKPERLFTHEDAFLGIGHRYDVSGDGQRFVVAKYLERPRASIHVVQNWFAEFAHEQ